MAQVLVDHKGEALHCEAGYGGHNNDLQVYNKSELRTKHEKFFRFLVETQICHSQSAILERSDCEYALSDGGFESGLHLLAPTTKRGRPNGLQSWEKQLNKQIRSRRQIVERFFGRCAQQKQTARC